MGFFSDLKEDLNQAVNELITEDTKEKETADAPETAQGEEPTLQQLADLEEMLQNIAELRIPEEEEDVEQASRQTTAESGQEAKDSLAQEPDPGISSPGEDPGATDGKEPDAAAMEAAELKETMESLQETMESIQDSLDQERAEGPEDTNLEQELRATFGAAEGEETVEDFMQAEAIRTGADVIDKSWVLDLKDMEAADETAVITAGMRVKGDILSNGSVDVIGEILGNVQVTGKLNVTGKIQGNSKAEEVFADSARITGDVISDGTVKIGAGSVVMGNIEATSAAIAGAVKGTIDVKGPVVLDATAVVLGNIRAKSMQINNGARIEGMCVLCYAEQSAAKFFENQDMM